MVICLERGADLHMAQLMALPLTVSCFSKIQIGFTFLVPAHPGSPGKGPLNVCVCVWCVRACSIHLSIRLFRLSILSCCRWFALPMHLVQLVLYLSADAYLCNDAYTGCTLACPPPLHYVKISVGASIATAIPLVLWKRTEIK